MEWHDRSVKVKLTSDLGIPWDGHDRDSGPELGHELRGRARRGQNDDGLRLGAVGSLNGRDGHRVRCVLAVEFGLEEKKFNVKVYIYQLERML